MGKQARHDFGDVEILPCVAKETLLYAVPPSFAPMSNRRTRDAEHGASADLGDGTRDHCRGVDGRRRRLPARHSWPMPCSRRGSPRPPVVWSAGQEGHQAAYSPKGYQWRLEP